MKLVICPDYAGVNMYYLIRLIICITTFFGGIYAFWKFMDSAGAVIIFNRAEEVGGVVSWFFLTVISCAVFYMVNRR
jgi:hypothetical protein